MTENEPKYRAKLDADGIYWGVEQVAALAAGDVEVPQECDLKPGHYRWNRDAKPEPCFEPLPKSLRRDAPEQPLTERALYELFLAMLEAGQPLPRYCIEWGAWFETTIDARGYGVDAAHPFSSARKGGV